MSTHRKVDSNPIYLRGWILDQLANLEVKPNRYQAMIAGIVEEEGQIKYRPDLMLAYWKKNGGGKAPTLPDDTKLGPANHYLLAAACFAHGDLVNQWYIPGDPDNKREKVRELKTKRIMAAWRSELQQTAEQLTDPTPEQFFEAWVNRPECTAGMQLGDDGGRQFERQKAAEGQALDAACSNLLRELARHVADKTPVLLVAYPEQRIDLERIETSASENQGLLISLPGSSYAILFEADDQYAIPAVRAMYAAHRLLSGRSPGRAEFKQSPSKWRLLMMSADRLLTGVQDHAASVQAVLSHEGLGPPAGEIYLDPYLWGTTGRWTAAERQPPTQVRSLTPVGESWARLDGFGNNCLVFGESTIEQKSLVCREEHLGELEAAWINVLNPIATHSKKRAAIVGVEGLEGSGKRSLLDVFFRNCVDNRDVSAVPLRFVNAGPDYPYRPYIEQILKVFDVDLCASSAEKLKRLESVFASQREVKRRHLQAILAAHDHTRQGYTLSGDALSPSVTSRSRQNISTALLTVVLAAIRLEAQKKPLVIVATDVHHASEGSKSLFWQVCEAVNIDSSINKLPIFLVYSIHSSSATENRVARDHGIPQIQLGPLNKEEYRLLVAEYNQTDVALTTDRIEAFWEAGPVYPGRFVSQLVLPARGETPRQCCSALLGRFHRPHGDPTDTGYSTVDAETVGALALMALLGDHAYPRMLAAILIELAELHSDFRCDHLDAHRDRISAWLEERAARAIPVGVLEYTSGESKHGRRLSYIEPRHADALQRRLRFRLAQCAEGRKLALAIAEVLTKPRIDKRARQWEAAATLVSSSMYGGRHHRYWRHAAEGSLRTGDPTLAKRQYRIAFRLLLREAGRSPKDKLLWTEVLEAYRRLIYAIRMQNVALPSKIRLNYEAYIKKSGIKKERNRTHFNTRLCLWHLEDLEGQHIRASKQIWFLRRAIDRQQSDRVTTQQHHELAYAAWATAISRGQLDAAARYYSQMMTLGVLSHSRDRKEISLSSGHDLELYAPARQSMVHWLTGDFSGVHEFRHLLLARLRDLPTDDAFRRFWASAYFIPVALFLRWHSTVKELLSYVQSEPCRRMGETMEKVSDLLGEMARLPNIRTAHELMQLLEPIMTGPVGPRGHKHRSVWVCLTARRWLDLDSTDELPTLAEWLDLTLEYCRLSGEEIFKSDLLRLKAVAHKRMSEHNQSLKMLGESIQVARFQGAVTLEIHAIQDHLTLFPGSSESKELQDRLKQLALRCDFPIDHPVAKAIKKSLSPQKAPTG